jgi:hypothetical protein
MENLLLPFRWKYAGLFLTLAGTVLSVLYLFFDFRFSMPVFAVFSSFLETKIFATFRTNFADELVLFLLISGLSLIVFSKEQNETEQLNLIRFHALMKAVLVNNVLLLFSLLFIYGAGFVAFLVFNLVSLQLFYLVFFYLSKKNPT